MADINDGGCAFPATEKQANGSHWHSHLGMSLRDYLAGQALAGLCANPGGPFQANGTNGWDLVNCSEGGIAKQCYRLADAMLAGRQGE